MSLTSSKAQRFQTSTRVEPFDWGGSAASARGDSPPAQRTAAPATVSAATASDVSAEHRGRLAELERDAFTKGYAQGERAGAEAAATRGEAMLRRLSQTLDELGALRSEMIRATERQLVQLAVAIAGRVLHREITLDRELLVAMARVALDRLGETSSATIRLNPDDYAVAGGGRAGTDEHSSVRVVADSMVRPGGCLVQSDFGLIDVGIDAQLTELTSALLGDGDAPVLQEVQQRVDRL